MKELAYLIDDNKPYFVHPSLAYQSVDEDIRFLNRADVDRLVWTL